MSYDTEDLEQTCESAEVLVVRIMARHGLSREACEDVIEEIQESILMAGGRESGGDVRKVHHLIERAFLTMRAYVRRGGDRDMAEKCLWLLLGFTTLAGYESVAEMVRKSSKEKATINNCIKFFQREMPELPPLPGQRCESSRSKMKKARLNQIK